MSIIKMTLIQCDNCGEAFASGDCKTDTATFQRKEAKKEGWKLFDGEDICNECQTKA